MTKQTKVEVSLDHACHLMGCLWLYHRSGNLGKFFFKNSSHENQGKTDGFQPKSGEKIRIRELFSKPFSSEEKPRWEPLPKKGTTRGKPKKNPGILSFSMQSPEMGGLPRYSNFASCLGTWIAKLSLTRWNVGWGIYFSNFGYSKKSMSRKQVELLGMMFQLENMLD